MHRVWVSTSVDAHVWWAYGATVMVLLLTEVLNGSLPRLRCVCAVGSCIVAIAVVVQPTSPARPSVQLSVNYACTWYRLYHFVHQRSWTPGAAIAPGARHSGVESGRCGSVSIVPYAAKHETPELICSVSTFVCYCASANERACSTQPVCQLERRQGCWRRPSGPPRPCAP